ncbi:transporter, major facilitator family protein [Dictyocaulus viviparus]|uniref:Transporter, major facilitator family protein n=1 Tax=Dictyocaulus viviparus TaxID=29172 RepID=A0A0D8XA87_DICVI|nr:transporter, major facilitator family protein [Dictyocaulus viviparus]
MQRCPSFRMVMVALVVSLGGSFHFGYQLVITNPAHATFIKFLNRTLESELKINVSDITLDIPSIVLYACSRITMGFSASLSLGLAALFLSESWFMIYIAEITIMVIFFVFLPLLPETPRFLVQRGAHKAAKKSVMFYYICDDDTAEGHMKNIKEEQKFSSKIYTMSNVIKKRSLRRKAMIGIVVTFAMSFSGVSVINAYAVQIFKGTGLSSREASLANVGIAFVSMHVCMGVLVHMWIPSCMLIRSKDSNSHLTTTKFMIGDCNLHQSVAVVISSMVVDKFGRRPLLLVSFTGCLICNLVIFILMLTFDKYRYNALGFILIFVICLLIVFFAIGPGPLSYFITAELVGQSARSGAQGWASVVQMLSRFLIVTIFLPMRDFFGESWSYLILFVGPIIISTIFLIFVCQRQKIKLQKRSTKLLKFFQR